MSISEIIVILIIALLVIKPEDIPAILKQFRKFYKYIISYKKQLEKEITNLTELEKPDEEIEKINFYLKKIMDLDEVYAGDYSLSDVKANYHRLIMKKKLEDKK